MKGRHLLANSIFFLMAYAVFFLWEGNSAESQQERDQQVYAEFSKKIYSALGASDGDALSALFSPRFKTLDEAFAEKDQYKAEEKGKLPSWFLKIRISESGMSQIGFMDLDRKYILDQVLVGQCLTDVAQVKPDTLLEILSSRFTTDPAPLDVLIYLSVNNGLVDRAAYDIRTDPWKNMEGAKTVLKMGESSNPIFRYLALQNAWRIGEVERIIFLKKFEADQDPAMREAYARALRGIGQRDHWF